MASLKPLSTKGLLEHALSLSHEIVYIFPLLWDGLTLLSVDDCSLTDRDWERVLVWVVLRRYAIVNIVLRVWSSPWFANQYLSEVILEPFLLLQVPYHVGDVLLEFNVGLYSLVVCLWFNLAVNESASMFGQELIQFVIVFLRELLWVDGSQNTLPWVYLLHYQLYVFLTYMERRRFKAVFWTVVAPAVPIGCLDTCW